MWTYPQINRLDRGRPDKLRTFRALVGKAAPAPSPLACNTFDKAFRVCAWGKRRLVFSQNLDPGRGVLGRQREACKLRGQIPGPRVSSADPRFARSQLCNPTCSTASPRLLRGGPAASAPPSATNWGRGGVFGEVGGAPRASPTPHARPWGGASLSLAYSPRLPARGPAGPHLSRHIRA